MTPTRFIQGGIWLTFVAVVYVALLVVDESHVVPSDWWPPAELVAFLSIGLIDGFYLLLGRMVMARRIGLGRAGRGGKQRTFLVASPYIPMWLLTMVMIAFAGFVLAVGRYGGAWRWPDCGFLAICLTAPLLLRSIHWGAARLDERGISVSWDDGLVSKIAWTTLPDLHFLEGRIWESELPRLPGNRSIQLVGRWREAALERARILWTAAQLPSPRPKEESEA